MNKPNEFSPIVQKFLLSLGFIQNNSQLFIFLKESNPQGRSKEINGIVWDLGYNKEIINLNDIINSLPINQIVYTKHQFICLRFTNIVTIHFITELGSVEVFSQEISLESNGDLKKQKRLHKKYPLLYDIFEGFNQIFEHLEKDNNICNLLASMFYFTYNFSKNGMCIGSSEISLLFGEDSIIKSIIFYYLTLYNKPKDSYNNWKEKYESFYDQRDLNDEFYLNISYFLLILDVLWLKSQIPFENSDLIFNIQNIRRYLKDSSYEPEYIFLSKYPDIFDVIIKFLHIFLCKISFKPQDLCSEIYQELIDSPIRHTLGEVYTPSYLIDSMIQSKTTTHKSFLDPACGCGSFLIGIINFFLKKGLDAINDLRIIGIDINPIAIHCCKINIIILLNSYRLIFQNPNLFNNTCIEIILDDALSPKNNETLKIIQDKVDFLIGNPPWINISSIFLQDSKDKIKKMGKELMLLYGPEAKNTEICTIFFYKCRDLYLKNEGSIFFVLPASVLNGHQHVFFRYFYKFKNIEVWRFKQDIFLIHNICLYAEYDMELTDENIESIKRRLSLKDSLFDISVIDNNSRISKLILKESRTSEPIYIKNNENTKAFPMIGRYNPVINVSKDSNFIYVDIEPGLSYYYPFVRGNIRIVPRRWVIIKEQPPFKEDVIIHPDIEQQAKNMWSDPPYSEFQVESDAIQPFYKSEQLIPFAFVSKNFAFLPITSDNKMKPFFNVEKMKPKTAKLYTLLDKTFRMKIKPSASMKTLEDNLTFNGRLIPTPLVLNGKQKYMVVHNSIGSIVKSVVLKESIIFDNSLYCFITENEDEAYYLSGVLNSPEMTYLVKKIGSSGSRGSLRNIHKNPYNFPIPKYDGSPLHIEISDISKDLHNFVQSFLIKNSSAFEKKTARAIQKQLFDTDDFKMRLKKLNENVIKIFKTA